MFQAHGGDYLVLFYQANGPRILGAFGNMTSGTVVSTYADTRVLRTCFPNGLCYSSPWGYPWAPLSSVNV